MVLNPRQPPGRKNRKARAFQVEIGRLFAEGYTCEAIRQALADAGLVVSKSTVQREVARHAKGGPPINASLTVERVANAAATPPAALSRDARSGKDIAADFFNSRVTNPLARKGSHDEDSRH